MSFHVVIPARYASTRLPGKPLALIGDMPLVQHVWLRAQAAGADEVIVATDDERIQKAVEAFGGVAVMTSAEHRSGTDRIQEVAAKCGWSDEVAVVNVQGDEPFIPAEHIRQVADALLSTDVRMSTLATPLTDYAQIANPNIVKVVTDVSGRALYFSRAPIPWDREHFPNGVDAPVSEGWLRHIGLYAYRVGFLHQYVKWQPAALELTESLEQLRVLWHGEAIQVAVCHDDSGPGIDTPEDLEQACLLWHQRQSTETYS